MKNLAILLCFSCCLGMANAQTTSTKSNKKKETASHETTKETSTKLDGSNTTDMNAKEHICSASCKNGKHIYAHGEKGHKCGAVCMRKMSINSKAYLKDHVCTAACKEGKHSYAHDEKGHTCTSACHKTKKVESVTPEKKS